MLLVLPASCDREEYCGEPLEKALEIYNDRCGFGATYDQPCDGVGKRALECEFSCIEHASCAAIDGEDMAANRKVFACQTYCEYFTYEGHRSPDSVGSIGAACEEMGATVRARLQACGVEMSDYDVDLSADCSEAIQRRDACYLGCYVSTSCADYLAGYEQSKLLDCLNGCR